MLPKKLAVQPQHWLRYQGESDSVRTALVRGPIAMEPPLDVSEPIVAELSPGLRASEPKAVVIVELVAGRGWDSLRQSPLEAGIYSLPEGVKPGGRVAREKATLLLTALVAHRKTDLPATANDAFDQRLAMLVGAAGSPTEVLEPGLRLFVEEMRRRYVLTRLNKDDLDPDWERALNSLPGWTWVESERLRGLDPDDLTTVTELLRRPPLGHRSVSERRDPQPPYPSLRFEFAGPKAALAAARLVASVPSALFSAPDRRHWLVEFDLPSVEDQSRESELAAALAALGGREVGRGHVLG